LVVQAPLAGVILLTESAAKTEGTELVIPPPATEKTAKEKTGHNISSSYHPLSELIT
jgi:hypothetical protein